MPREKKFSFLNWTLYNAIHSSRMDTNEDGDMGMHSSFSLYDQLDTEQKDGLAQIHSGIGAFKDRQALSSLTSTNDEIGDRVISMLESWLLDEEQKRDLMANSWDIFFLYAAAYGLDYRGDANAHPGHGNEATGAVAKDGRAPDTGAARWSSNGIADNRQAEIISLISNAQMPSGAWNEAVPPVVSYRNGVHIHVQFIAACLHLAAAFILDAPAIREQILSHLRQINNSGGKRLRQCFSVTSVGSHPHLQATIRVRLQCNDAEVHRALKHYESRLQRLLSGLNRLVRPRFLFTAVSFEISPNGYQPIDLKFSVDTSSALQLFMGNTLYTDRRVFLRELIQNAVDACNLRKLYEPGYTPAIGVDFNRDISKIRVRDNGIGMSKQWIEKYFLNIGLSFYQSDEIIRINRDADIQFSFISRFGIGFLSCFLVAGKVVVKTRKAGEDGLVVTITSIDDYFDVRVLQEEMPVGTEVTVVLKENSLQYSRSLEYLGYLKTNVRFLPIAVTVKDEHGLDRVLGREPMDYDEEIRWGTKFTAQLDYHSSRGYLLLRVLENAEYIYDLEASQGGISIFQDGIFITQVDYLLPESARSYMVGRLNLVGEEKCELSMDRNRIYWGKDQLIQTKKRVLSGIVTIANRLMDVAAQQSIPETVDRNLTRKLADFFDFNDVDDTLHARLNRKLRTMVEDKFQLFIRANRYQFDLSRRKQSKADDSHGYYHAWQKRFIDEFKMKERPQRQHSL